MLYKSAGYDHREDLFGMPAYGGSISQNVYYADSDLCDPSEEIEGYPQTDSDGDDDDVAPFPAPYILMVNRGGCTFVQKVRKRRR
jgi:hypothetical protein